MEEFDINDELLEEVEETVDEFEHEFEEVKDEDATGSLKEKQEKAENILNEIHDQLSFLKEVSDEGFEQKE